MNSLSLDYSNVLSYYLYIIGIANDSNTINPDTINLNIYIFLLTVDILYSKKLRHKNGSTQLKKHKNTAVKYHIELSVLTDIFIIIIGNATNSKSTDTYNTLYVGDLFILMNFL